MSEKNSNDPLANSGRDKPKSKSARKIPASRSKAGDVGKALRSVYDKALREDVPSDFLDLLGKLT